MINTGFIKFPHFFYKIVNIPLFFYGIYGTIHAFLKTIIILRDITMKKFLAPFLVGGVAALAVH